MKINFTGHSPTERETELSQEELAEIFEAQQQVEKIYDVWEEEWLKSKDFYEHRALAAAFRELITQCGYTKDELLVVNIRDIIGIVEVLEEM